MNYAEAWIKLYASVRDFAKMSEQSLDNVKYLESSWVHAEACFEHGVQYTLYWGVISEMERLWPKNKILGHKKLWELICESIDAHAKLKSAGIDIAYQDVQNSKANYERMLSASRDGIYFAICKGAYERIQSVIKALDGLIEMDEYT